MTSVHDTCSPTFRLASHAAAATVTVTHNQSISMSTNIDHVPFENTAEDAADHRRQLILVVSGNASPQVAECLASEIGTDYIGGATILQDLEENTNKAEVHLHHPQPGSKKEGRTDKAIGTRTRSLKGLHPYRDCDPHVARDYVSAEDV